MIQQCVLSVFMTKQIYFQAIGATATSIGYSKASINSHIVKWAWNYNIDPSQYVIVDQGARVYVQFLEQKHYTLFLLTWKPELSFLEPKLL